MNMNVIVNITMMQGDDGDDDDDDDEEEEEEIEYPLVVNHGNGESPTFR